MWAFRPCPPLSYSFSPPLEKAWACVNFSKWTWINFQLQFQHVYIHIQDLLLPLLKKKKKRFLQCSPPPSKQLEGNTSQLSFNLTRGILSAKARWEKRDRLQNRRLQVPDDILYVTHIQYWRFLKPQQQRHGERGDSGTVTQLLWTPQLQSKSGAPVKSYCSSCNSFNTSPLGLHYLDSCQNTTHVRYESFHFLFFGFYISS